MKLDILAIGVHPDDVEISAGGTVLAHIAMGKKVGLLDLTRGEMGTRGSGEIRDQESAMAAKMMGLSVRIKLNMLDCKFQNDIENQTEIIKIIRLLRPEVVFTNAVFDRHPDHGRASQLCYDACFYAGLMKWQSTWEGKPQTAWRPRAIYSYIQDYDTKPDFLVDISPYMERKIEILKAYRSQFYDPQSKEPSTPISGETFFDFIKSRGRNLGRCIQADFAEGFTIYRPLGVKNVLDLL